jgi:hypothetical protein
MPNESQLSTILLLCVLAYVIYQLTDSSCLTSESFANEENKSPLNQIYDQSVLTNQNNALPASNDNVTSSPAPVNVMNNVSNNASVNVPSEAVVQPPQENVPKQDAVNMFSGNDLALSGADLGSAYNTPLPEGVKADSLDLNKNNVTSYNSKDFLPKEVNNEWFDTDFSQAKNNLNDDKLINTDRYVIGVNTVGQSLKNASYDIRGTIPNPKFSVSPWNNSTYEPDYNLKPLC